MTIELISAIYKAGCKKEIVRLPLSKEDDFTPLKAYLRMQFVFMRRTALENLPSDDISVW